MRNLILSTLSTLALLALLIYPLSLSAQNTFSLSLDVDSSTGDQAVTFVNASADQVVAIQIFGNNIQNANGLAVRFEYDTSQVTYEGFDTGDVLPNAQILTAQGTNFIQISLVSLGGQATANSGLVGTIRFRTMEAFSSTAIQLVRAELGRGGQIESATLNVRVELKLQVLTPDFNRDGMVNFADFLLFVGQFGARQGDGRYDAKYDLDSDDAIGFGDFLIFGSSFGQEVSTPGGSGDGGSTTTVDIPDANLRAVIANTLGKASGAPITEAEMKTLTRLDAVYKEIRDLTGLEFATNLTSLVLDYNQISEVSPLANLINLTTLSLYYNQISEVSPLANLINLTWLGLSTNQISEVSPLANLINLTTLDLGSNQISEVSPLANLINLTTLSLSNNQISEVSPLANLINLTTLFLYDNQIDQSLGIPSRLDQPDIAVSFQQPDLRGIPSR